MRRTTLGLLLLALIATACGTYGPPVRQSATATGSTPGEAAPESPTDEDRKR